MNKDKDKFDKYGFPNSSWKPSINPKINESEMKEIKDKWKSLNNEIKNNEMKKTNSKLAKFLDDKLAESLNTKDFEDLLDSLEKPLEKMMSLDDDEDEIPYIKKAKTKKSKIKKTEKKEPKNSEPFNKFQMMDFDDEFFIEE